MAFDSWFGFDLIQRKTLENKLATGVPAATTTQAGVVLQAAVQNPAVAADVAALKTQFDALLTKLKAAGLMAS